MQDFNIQSLSFFLMLQYKLLMMKNTQILILLSLVLLSSTLNLNHKSLTQNLHEDQQKYDVIVIGAGFAGTSAASQLAKAGKKVLLLEASDHIGGRTHHKNVPLLGGQSINFQYGANFIHGANSEHPVYQLALQMKNVQLRQAEFTTNIVYDEDRNDITQLVNGKYDQYKQVLHDLYSLSDKNISIYEGLKQKHPQKLEDKYFMYNTGAIEFDEAASITDINVDSKQGYAYFDGPQMFVISGFSKMPKYLSKHENIKVLLNHKVTQVKQAGQKTKVACQNGFKASASSVVIAVPLGVLKKKTIEFIPQLPEWKTTAIDKIGFGNVCKVLVVPTATNIDVPQTEDILGIALNDVNQRGTAIFWFNLQEIANLQVQLTFGLGPNADKIEMMPQAELKELIAKRLTLFMNSTVQASQFDVYRSSWRSNPNIGGAYSMPGIYTEISHWDDMAKPLQDRNWFFAGEHTYRIYRGTTHGALLSGKVAAKNILDSKDKKKD